MVEQAPFQEITLSTKGWGGWDDMVGVGGGRKVRQERGEAWGQCRGGRGNWEGTSQDTWRVLLTLPYPDEPHRWLFL